MTTDTAGPAGNDPETAPLVSKPALWAGVIAGGFLGYLMIGNGVWVPLPMPGFLAAAVTFLAVTALAVAGAEMLGRHHRVIRSHAARHGRRGASAAYRGARKHGGRGAAFVAAQAQSQWERRRPAPEREAAADESGPPPPGAWASPAPSPESPVQPSNPTGGIPMTGNGTRQPAARRRPAANGGVPGAWGAVVAHTADFQAESDGDLLGWMRGEAMGAAGYAESLVEQYEVCRDVIGVDPVAIQTLHDVADAATTMAATMAAAVKRFAEHYELPTQFVADGGLLAHDGRWHKGDDA